MNLVNFGFSITSGYRATASRRFCDRDKTWDNRRRRNTARGFSLIELLVSISIFIIVLIMAVGSLLVVIGANARAQNMEQVMTNLSFALDSVSREVRTGRGFYCSGTDPGGNLSPELTRNCTNGKYLSVVEGGESLTAGKSNPRVSFRYNATNKSIDRRVGNGNWFQITAPNVVITDMYFYVADTATAAGGDSKQANVTLYVAGHSGDLPTSESSFAVQTTVTRRIPDIF